ncbi:MAG: M28 family metallopeptidase [Promethearchaeota archaeon]
MSHLTLYEEQSALNHVKNLAFSRRAATDGETKSITYIVRELDKNNIQTSVEAFEWYISSTILMKLAIIFTFIYLVIYGIISFYPNITWSYLPLDILFITIIYYGEKFLFNNTKILHFGTKKESKNVITKIFGKDIYPQRPVIIFSAHHDSISQRYSMRMKIVLYISALILFFAYFIFTFILSIWSLLALFSITKIDYNFIFLRNISLIIEGFLLITMIAILGNKDSNQSIGAIDNASGVAILLELAKLINKNPLEKTDVIFFWSGAEEIGCMGSKDYCSKHFEELNYDYDLNDSYIINIDMVGTYVAFLDKTGLLKKKKINSNLNNVLEASAIHIKSSIEKETITLGTFSDHKIFQSLAKKAGKNNFQASVFSSDRDTKYIHSKKDTPDKCSTTNLNACIDICYNAIKSLDLRVE